MSSSMRRYARSVATMMRELVRSSGRTFETRRSPEPALAVPTTPLPPPLLPAAPALPPPPPPPELPPPAAGAFTSKSSFTREAMSDADA